MLIPVMKEYIDASVSNNDQLIKLAGILQKLISTNSSKDSGKELQDALPQKEKDALLQELYGIANKASSKITINTRSLKQSNDE